MNNQIINSWEDLQKNVKRIAVALNKDENLKLAAASNPLLALDELGYEINLDLKGIIEDKMRFRNKDVERLSELRKSVFEHAGKIFDIRSENELNTVLFDELKLIAYNEKGCPLNQNISAVNSKLKYRVDELNEYTGLHLIVKPLIEFRQIDSSVAGFCNNETYQKIRKGKAMVNSRIKLSIRLKTHN